MMIFESICRATQNKVRSIFGVADAHVYSPESIFKRYDGLRWRQDASCSNDDIYTGGFPATTTQTDFNTKNTNSASESQHLAMTRKH